MVHRTQRGIQTSTNFRVVPRFTLFFTASQGKNCTVISIITTIWEIKKKTRSVRHTPSLIKILRIQDMGSKAQISCSSPIRQTATRNYDCNVLDSSHYSWVTECPCAVHADVLGRNVVPNWPPRDGGGTKKFGPSWPGRGRRDMPFPPEHTHSTSTSVRVTTWRSWSLRTGVVRWGARLHSTHTHSHSHVLLSIIVNNYSSRGLTLNNVILIITNKFFCKLN